ncbi:hypothetical protein DFH28DRAFT_952682 [Melampsora americana]|nr:hypothetical protein DFH28DRAFT_952682 [Melampsora americana]
MKLPIFSSKGSFFLIFIFNYTFISVFAPTLDPFSLHHTKTYSLWQSRGILDQLSSHLPESDLTLDLNGNPWLTTHPFSYFQYQLDYPKKEILIEDPERKIIGNNQQPKQDQILSSELSKPSNLEHFPADSSKIVKSPNEDVNRRKYSTVVQSKMTGPVVMKSDQKNGLNPISQVSSGPKLRNGKEKEIEKKGSVKVNEGKRLEDLNHPSVSKIELGPQDSRDKIHSDQASFDSQREFKNPSKAMEMISPPGLPKITRSDSPLVTKSNTQVRKNSGSKKSVSETRIEELANELQPKGLEDSLIVDKELNRDDRDPNERIRSSEFENENPYRVLDKYFKTVGEPSRMNDHESKKKPIETDEGQKESEDDSQHEMYSVLDSSGKNELNEEEKVEGLKGTSELVSKKERSNAKVPSKSSQMSKKFPKKGKKMNKKINLFKQVDSSKETSASSNSKEIINAFDECDKELQGLEGCVTKDSFMQISKYEFLKRSLKMRTNTEGIKINLSDLEFEYMIQHDFATDPKSWNPAIQMFALNFNEYLEGKRRLMTLLEQFKERELVRRWENQKKNLSPLSERIGNLLKADQIFPLFENAKIEEWIECHDELFNLIKTNEIDELVKIFGLLFQNRVATLAYMAYAHTDSQSRVLKEIIRDGSVIEGVRIPVLMSIANILELSSERVNWEKLSKEEVLEKSSELMRNFNGVIRLPSGHKFQVFEHPWNQEYTMYRLIQKKGGKNKEVDWISTLFSIRLKTLSHLSDLHQLKIPMDWLKRLPTSAQEISLGEALICVHVDLHFDLLKELKDILRSQPRKSIKNPRIIGTWTPEHFPEHLVAKTVEFQRFFALRDQIVKDLGTL